MTTDDLHSPGALSLDEFLWVLAQIPVLRAWANSVEAEAMRRLLSGEKLPGFKLVEGRTNRKWADTEKAIKVLLKLGFSVDDITPRELVSPAQTEKLFKKSKLMPRFGLVSKFMERPRGKASIAPDDDPRPEFARGEEFKDQPVEQDE